MNNQRRLFLSQVSLMAGFATLNKPLTSLASASKKISSLHSSAREITIYYTNDLHGKIGPVYDNLGGIDNVNAVIERQDISGLLFDAGDFLNNAQNKDQHKQMISSMNTMGYHAVTLGNNELANGQEYLAALIPQMKFSIVNCNYQFGEQLSGLVSQYIVINKGKFKIGITGVGHQINGVIYNDAIESANKVAALLKEKEHCDLVICLSHLGYKQAGDMPDNQKLAFQSEHIDLIIGGHNRRIMSGPMILRNKLDNEVMISHTAWDGLMMGKTVFNLSDDKQKHSLKAQYFIPGQPSGETFALAFSKLQGHAV